MAEGSPEMLLARARRLWLAGRYDDVLEALAASPEPLDVDRMCEQVWPGERLVAQSGTRRVHVAISTLRGLGLRNAIQTDVSGDTTTWRLDADVVDSV